MTDYAFPYDPLLRAPASNLGEQIEESKLARGMTLRDYFAAQALIGMGTWTPNEPTGAPVRNIERRIELQAWWAYKVADAMLKERNK